MKKIYASISDKIEPREIAHANLSRALAGECQVLLENDGTLPLKTKVIALFGSGARKTIKGGTGSGDVNTRDNINIEQGFLKEGYTITSTNWLNKQETAFKNIWDAYMKEIEQLCQKKHSAPMLEMMFHPFSEPEPVLIEPEDMNNQTDTAVFVISRNSGEGSDRYAKKGDYYLFDNELKNLQTLTGFYKKVVVVLNIGGVMDLSELKMLKGINAILLMSQLGNLGGQALVDVLSGTVNPSGKTTDTWAKDYWDYPSSKEFSHNGSIDDEEYTDGVYVGYKYFESFNVKPEYCFGYGKSYTSFEVSPENVELCGSDVVATVSVKNTGNCNGKEVIQLYVAPPQYKLDKPYKSLKAFKKTSLLQPSQSEQIQLNFDFADCASYYEDFAAYMLEKGNYLIYIGTSSQNATPVAVISINNDIKTFICKNFFKLDTKLEQIKPDTKLLSKRQEEEAKKAKFHLTLSEDQIHTKTAEYTTEHKNLKSGSLKQFTLQDVKNGNCTLDDLVAQLSIPQMAEMCVGTLRLGQKSVIGNASYMVPGAAGDTSSILAEERKADALILADGPAGLRLIPHFQATKDGKIIQGSLEQGGLMGENPQNYAPEEIIDYYQYCTAIPIGWALAQSWNEELIMQAGDMVGKEMEQFNIDLWLAPALNIHRNPLCGRNFEYYSEDPLISGKIAANMTKGVQKHKGKGTTLKHFAANNQEDNRFRVNAHICERAIRELYLKGFEIAVKESSPLSIMTSYNLLNGIHTANQKELLQYVCRDEWGFEGVYMTDWFSSQEVGSVEGPHKAVYPSAKSTGCIFAGADIQMPGCQKNVDDIIKAITNNQQTDGFNITLGDLQFCTKNVLRAIIKCGKVLV